MNVYAKVLFFVFVSLFTLTAIITLLALTGYVTINEQYLSKLFYGLIGEIVTSIINFFALLFLSRKTKLRFDITETYDKNSVNKFKCNITLRDPETGKDTILPCNLYDDKFGLCGNVRITNYNQTLSVIIDIDGKKYSGSEWLETRTIILKPI